jgi:hypothetical protein
MWREHDVRPEVRVRQPLQQLRRTTIGDPNGAVNDDVLVDQRGRDPHVRLPGRMLSDRFRAAVECGNVDTSADLFSETAIFRSPVLFKPYQGRDQVVKVLQAAERVLGLAGEFRYVHQLEDPHDRVAILEFATKVEGKLVEGIDKLTFDEDGMITELKVMIRPASALQLVGAKMAEEFRRAGVPLPS